jgi:hypothetical protein
MIGQVGADKIDNEFRIITRYTEWCNLVKASESKDDKAVSYGRNNQAREIIIVRLTQHAA